MRGWIEGFSTAKLAVVTSGFLLGFLSGARLTRKLIQWVGHVQIFAALGSLMSAGLIAFTLLEETEAHLGVVPPASVVAVDVTRT